MYKKITVVAALAVVCAAGVQAGTEVPLVNSVFDSGLTPPTGWVDVDANPSIRGFNAGGQRMISTGTDGYQAQQITTTAIQANTRYLLEWDNGFATGNAVNADWNVHIGSDGGGTWTSLGTKSGNITSAQNAGTGGDDWDFAEDNAHYNSYQLTTGGSVSGNVGVQLGVATGHDWLGYDNAYLSSFAANEIIIGNHSFNMSTRDNQGALVGGADNLEAWTEISGDTNSRQNATGLDREISQGSIYR
jgi:hypothetical protein